MARESGGGGRPMWGATTGSIVALAAVAAAVFSGSFEGLPRANESLSQYASRALAISADAAESLYLRALSLVPGGATVTVGILGDHGKLEASSDRGDEKGQDSAQDNLKQGVAQNEDEIQAQQDVSVKRYMQAKAATANGEPFMLPEHPDEVRSSMPPVNPDGPEMRCSEPIPTHSTVITRGIELVAYSEYRGNHGWEHTWKYMVTFHNRGEETVQMLTRHWVFIDETGQVNEVKGPGARGVTPVLPPGGEWSYESGTSLSTPFGSMHGSFQFEVLQGDLRRRSFSARVGRLLLTSSGAIERRVPCGDTAATGMLPQTGVFAVERVILGGRAILVSRRKDQYIFQYDVQFNNARDSSIEVVAHSWEVVDSKGRRAVVMEGSGVGGSLASKSKRLQAGDAFRVQGRIASPTAEANAQGTYKVIITAADGLLTEVEVRTDYMGLAAEESRSHVPNFVVDPRFR